VDAFTRPVGTEGAASHPRRIEILGCPTDVMDMRTTVDRCCDLIRSRRGTYQVSINALKIELAERDQEFAQLLWRSSIASPDGQSVVWAARMLGQPLPERVNGTDLMLELLAAAEREGFSAYVLGARREVLERALARIRALYPKLKLSGSRDGYFEHSQEPRVVDEIRESSPDLLFVAMPSPRKEQFIARYIDRLSIGLAMGVGGSVDVIAGDRFRAPRWVQQLGLEWLFRLSQDPGMWRRYLSGNTRLILRTVQELMSRRRRR
jgi:N-acetylglucosaminyldiphosphoundecaprenol N-acetyl-beta-D-mannosaminyltransferase